MTTLFWKALLGLMAYDLLVLCGNFSTLHYKVRRWPVSHSRSLKHTTDQVCAAVNRACSWYPKRSLCLQRAAVTACLLRSCGIPADMVLGAQKIPFKAHAWVEVGGRAINELSDVQRVYCVWEKC